MLGLRSSRAGRSDRADSQSGCDDEEDDGFEILTAENLFSTLLSRVRITYLLNFTSFIPPYDASRKAHVYEIPCRAHSLHFD